MFRYRFACLLVALLFFFLLTAYVRTALGADRGPFAPIASWSAFTLLLLGSMNAARSQRMVRMVGWGIAVVAILLHAASDFFGGGKNVALSAATGLAILLLGLTVYLILGHIFVGSRRVTVDTICASLCVYLLLAVIWSGIYSIVATNHPGEAFTEDFSFDSGQTMNSVYFSLVTLTTLGYGDISPTSPWARMLAAIEAVVGQIYLTVLVAHLVGMRLSQTFESVPGEDKSEPGSPASIP